VNLKNVFYTVLIVFCTLSMTACAGNPKKDELVMWLVGSEAQARTIMELSKDFTGETGVKVLCQAISWWNAHSKYLISIAGDVTPDIGTMGLTWGMEFGELGAMIDLRSNFPDDMATLERSIFRGIMDSTKVGDKVYGVPFDMTEQIMYYRKDIVPEPPVTWEGLMDILKALKTRGKGMIIDWGSLDWIGFSPFLWQAGADFFSGDNTSVALDDPRAAEALAYFGKLYKEGVPKTNVPLEQGMRTGDYPLAISGNWKIISLTLGAPDIKGKWSIAMLPEGPSGKRTAFVGGRIMGIFSRSSMREEAWEFIKFLSRADIQEKLYKASLETEDSYFPPNMNTWKGLKMDQEFKDVLENQARDAKGPPPVLGWDSCTRFVNHAIQMVVLKDADPASELLKASVEMQKELERGLENNIED